MAEVDRTVAKGKNGFGTKLNNSASSPVCEKQLKVLCRRIRADQYTLDTDIHSHRIHKVVWVLGLEYYLSKFKGTPSI